MNYWSLLVPALISGFCMQNSDFWTRITNLYGSQTSPVVFCMQYSVISTRITCLYGSQPLSVVFSCKTAAFDAELQVSMCPSCHLWFFHVKQRILDQNFKSLWVPALICGFCIPNNEFLPRITSLYGSQTSPALLWNQIGVICTRINRLYWVKLSPVVLCMQNSVLSIRITSLHGSQPSCVFFAFKTATFGAE